MRWRAGKYVLVIFAVLTMTLGCQGLFEDLDDLDGPGESGPNFELTAVNDVEAQGATFRAAIYDLGGEANFEHGFCWSTERRPQLGDDPCHSLGTVDSTGPFAYTTEELEPGQTYHVRAFLSARGDEFYSEEETFQTTAPAPFDVEAEINDDGFVELTWDSLSGVDEFEIYRDADGEPLGSVDGETKIFVDEDIESGAALPRIENITASSDDPSGVLVRWEEIGGDGGMEITYIYWVKAIYPETESPLSDGADIQVVTEPEIEGYQIQIDGGEWIDVSEAQYIDTDAAPPEIVADFYASQGEYFGFVELTVDEGEIESFDGEERTYIVRVVGPGDEVGPPSADVHGRRSPYTDFSAANFVWMAPSDAGVAEPVLPDGEENVRHFDAPDDGTPVEYELWVFLPEYNEEVQLGTVEGWRRPPVDYLHLAVFDPGGGAIPGQTYDFEGSNVGTSFGGDDVVYTSLAADPEGNIYVAGVEFIGGVTSGSGYPDRWFIRKKDSSGVEEWGWASDIVSDGEDVAMPYVEVTASGEVWAAATVIYDDGDQTMYSYEMRQFDSSGTTIFSGGESGEMFISMAAHGDDIYFGTTEFDSTGEQSHRIHRIDSASGAMLSYSMDAMVRSIAVGDGSNAVYVGLSNGLIRVDFSHPDLIVWDTREFDDSSEDFNHSYISLAVDADYVYAGTAGGKVQRFPYLSNNFDFIEIEDDPGSGAVVAVASEPMGKFFAVWRGDEHDAIGGGVVRGYQEDGESDPDEGPSTFMEVDLGDSVLFFDLAIVPGVWGVFPDNWQ